MAKSSAELSYQIPRAALLWVLASVIMVLIPQTVRMPLWISVVAVFCIGWRVLIFRGKLNYPGRIIRGMLVAFTLLVLVSQLRTLGVGLDAAASLLALGFVFKLIEMQYKRDIYVVLSLSFVMSLVAFIYSQSAVSTLYILAVIVVTVAAMVALNRSVLVSEGRTTFSLATKIVLQAIPLTVVLFVLFPRIAPLWAVPVQNNVNSTGVTDEMSPGDISQLGRSGELAFRVKFNGMAPPLHQELYWRGLVLDDFDGTTWSRQRYSFYSSAAASNNFTPEWEGRKVIESEPYFYNIIMEPTQQPWLFGLHLAEPETRELYQSSKFELFNNGLVTQRLSYDLRSYREHKTDVVMLGSLRRRALELPEDGNERSMEFARDLRARSTDDLNYAYQVLSYFQREPFFYTLDPPLLTDDRIDDFLFNSREGFCEHYASSFTYLMRAAGVPARVVVGYQGAEYNRFEDYLMVYQYNAHAWSEVWIEGEGWMRFDPTAAVSPERVEQGVEEALRNDPAFLEESLFSAARLGGMAWLNTIRLRFDAFEYEWNRRVVNYNEEVQFEFFERLFGNVSESKILGFLGFSAVLVILLVSLTVIRFKPRTQYDPANKTYIKLCAELERAGLPRQRGEGPLDYCRRVASARPDLAEDMWNSTRLYVRLNYRCLDDDAKQRERLLSRFKRHSLALKINLMPINRLRS